MKIVKSGEVRVTDHGIFVEGFQFESEAGDPVEAKPEELGLALVIDWGWNIFLKEVQRVEKSAMGPALARARALRSKPGKPN